MWRNAVASLHCNNPHHFFTLCLNNKIFHGIVSAVYDPQEVVEQVPVEHKINRVLCGKKTQGYMNRTLVTVKTTLKLYKGVKRNEMHLVSSTTDSPMENWPLTSMIVYPPS
jgi:hypothetical protein